MKLVYELMHGLYSWNSKMVKLVHGLHQECLGVVKLVMGLHHVGQGGKQGEFRDGGASV